MPELAIPCYLQLWPPTLSLPDADLQGSWGLLWTLVTSSFFSQGTTKHPAFFSTLQRWVNPGIVIPPPSKLQLSQLPSPSVAILSVSFPSPSVIIFSISSFLLAIFYTPLYLTVKQIRDAVCETKHTETSFTPVFPNTIATQERHRSLSPFCAVLLIVSLPNRLYRCLQSASAFTAEKLFRDGLESIFGDSIK